MGGDRASNKSPRIPISLQAVFIASNRGKNVNTPPPDASAASTFFRNWVLKGKRSKKTSSKKTATPPSTEKKRPTRVKADIRQTATQKIKSSARPPMSPQAYLDVLIHSRGYSTRRYRTLQSGYYNKPTPLQIASYDRYLVNLVKSHDEEQLHDVMNSGISPNPCNNFGESLVHMICRRGDSKLLNVMLEAGTNVRIADDYGRTPLHDACWAAQPSFEVVQMIATKDMSLFHMTDTRGAVPLSYVRRDHWQQWIEFLESKKDSWWPKRSGPDRPPELLDVAPNTNPLQDPPNALNLELAKMVASGKMTPEDVALLCEDEDDESDGGSNSDHSDAYSDYDSEEDDFSDSDDDDDMLEEDEMADMLQRIQFSRKSVTAP